MKDRKEESLERVKSVQVEHCKHDQWNFEVCNT